MEQRTLYLEYKKTLSDSALNLLFFLRHLPKPQFYALFREELFLGTEIFELVDKLKQEDFFNFLALFEKDIFQQGFRDVLFCRNAQNKNLLYVVIKKYDQEGLNGFLDYLDYTDFITALIATDAFAYLLENKDEKYIYNFFGNVRIGDFQQFDYVDLGNALHRNKVVDATQKIAILSLLSIQEKIVAIYKNHKPLELLAIFNRDKNEFAEVINVLLQYRSALPELPDETKKNEQGFFRKVTTKVISYFQTKFVRQLLDNLLTFVVTEADTEVFKEVCFAVVENLQGLADDQFDTPFQKSIYLLKFLYLSKHVEQRTLETYTFLKIMDEKFLQANLSLEDLTKNTNYIQKFQNALDTVLPELITLYTNFHGNTLLHENLLHKICQLNLYYDAEKSLNNLKTINENFTWTKIPRIFLANAYYSIECLSPGLHLKEMFASLQEALPVASEDAEKMLIALAERYEHARFILCKYYLADVEKKRSYEPSAKGQLALTWLREMTEKKKSAQSNPFYSQVYELLGLAYHSNSSSSEVEKKLGLNFLVQAIRHGNENARDYLKSFTSKNKSLAELFELATLIYTGHLANSSIVEVIRLIFTNEQWDETCVPLINTLFGSPDTHQLFTFSQLTKIIPFLYLHRSTNVINVALKDEASATIWLNGYSKLPDSAIVPPSEDVEKLLLVSKAVDSIHGDALLKILQNHYKGFDIVFLEDVLFRRPLVCAKFIENETHRNFLSSSALPTLVLHPSVYTNLTAPTLCAIIRKNPEIVHLLCQHKDAALEMVTTTIDRAFLGPKMLQQIMAKFNLQKELSTDILLSLIFEFPEFAIYMLENVDLANKFLIDQANRLRLSPNFLTIFLSDQYLDKGISIDVLCEIVLESQALITSLTPRVAKALLCNTDFRKKLQDEPLISLFVDPIINKSLPNEVVVELLLRFKSNEIVFSWVSQNLGSRLITIAFSYPSYAIKLLSSPYLEVIKNHQSSALSKILRHHASNTNFLTAVSKQQDENFYIPYSNIINYVIKNSHPDDAKQLLQNEHIYEAIKFNLFYIHKKTVISLLTNHRESLSKDLQNYTKNKVSWLGINYQGTLDKKELLEKYLKMIEPISNLTHLKRLLLDMTANPLIKKFSGLKLLGTTLHEELVQHIKLIENPELDIKDQNIVITCKK